MDAVDSENAAKKKEKYAAAKARADEDVKGMNERAATKEWAPMVKRGLEDANLNISDKAMNELSNKLAMAMARNGGKVDEASMNAAIAEALKDATTKDGSPINPEEVGQQVGIAARDAITSALMSTAQESNDVAGMLKLLATQSTKDNATNKELVAAITKLTAAVDDLKKSK